MPSRALGWTPLPVPAVTRNEGVPGSSPGVGFRMESAAREGWLYLQLAGSYARYGTLEAAFPDFVARVETLTRNEVREYVSTIIAEQRPRRLRHRRTIRVIRRPASSFFVSLC